MDIIINLFSDLLQFGLVYAILAIGVFISYRLLDFADMSCEGTYVFGGALAIVMISLGVPALLATIIAVIGGFLAGLLTGVLHAKLHIPGLLAGIITMTGLFSINMVIFGLTKKGVSFDLMYNSFCTITYTTKDPTIFGLFSFMFDTRKYYVIVMLILIVIIVAVLIYLFFGTEFGMSMRATGMNPKMARAQGINTNLHIILGLGISNALIAFAASLAAQRDLTISTTSGTGMLVFGLASIIIGEAVVGKKSFKRWIISVIVGAMIYYFIIQIAITLGFPNHLLKFLYAVLIVLILSYPLIKKAILKAYNRPDRKQAREEKKNKTNEEIVTKNEEIVIPTLSEQNIDVSNLPELKVSEEVKLEANNVVKIFNPTGNPEDEKIALNGLNVNVKDGEFVTIIGGNGSGKSTFFNTVSGVYIPESGSIKINGEDVTKLPEYKRAYFIGRVAQDPYQGTAHDMSILENMSIAMRRNKSKTLKWGFNKENTNLFKEKISTLGLGLENRMSAKIGTLSGGQRQAVTLLMATLQRPDVLFLDEHTAALDPKTAKTVLDLTDKIVRENNLTAVMVTHNMKDAIKYGNRLLMFNNGKVIYDVSGEEKKNLTVEDLLRKFENKVEFSDKDILG